MQLSSASMRRSAAKAVGAPSRAVRTRPVRTLPLSSSSLPHTCSADRRRVLVAAAAGNDSSSRGDAPEQPPAEASIQAAADAVEDAVADVADATAAAVDDAAASATAVVSDAADVTSALVSDAAGAATALVEDAADAADAVAAAAQQVATAAGDALSAAAANLPGQPAAIDWAAAPAPGMPDARFAGLKVLVAGATGGTGRRVVEALRAKGVPTRALVRNSSRAAQLLPPPSDGSDGPAFEVVSADVFQYASLPSAFAGGVNALVIATAANDKADPLGPFNIDYQGTLNLLAAAKRAGVQRVAMVSSIGADELLNPLNLFWGILFWKKRGEEAVQRSGLAYTIVRPGGLLNTTPPGRSAGSLVMERPGEFGFPPLKRSGAILRSQVADIVVEALVCPAAVDKVVEVVAEASAPTRPLDELFASVRM